MSSSAILPTANITHIFWWCARTNLIGCWIIVFFSNKKKIVEKLNFYSGLHESFVRRLLGRFHQLKLNFKKIESICRSKWSCHFQRQFWEKNYWCHLLCSTFRWRLLLSNAICGRKFHIRRISVGRTFLAAFDGLVFSSGRRGRIEWPLIAMATDMCGLQVSQWTNDGL